MDVGPVLSISLWLIGSSLALLLLQPQVHRRLQTVSCLLTGGLERGLVLYSLILLPGVIVHEASHWLAAKALGVRTARVSFRPQLQRDGALRLGYVEIRRADFVRESLIGVAPLLAGTGVVLLLGLSVLRIGEVGQLLTRGSWISAGNLTLATVRRPCAGFWLYLAFAVSNAMFPSPSDRRAWPWVGMILIAGTAMTMYLGAGLRLWQALEPLLTGAAQGLASAFTFAAAVDVVVIPLLWAGESVLGRLRSRSS